MPQLRYCSSNSCLPIFLFSTYRSLNTGNTSQSKRVPNCQKCGQHGRKSRLKGHKRVCPYKDCSCAKCQVVSERQKLMADQIKIRRRQRKDTLMNFTRKKITDTLNAAAVVAATAPVPYLNSFNALLYKQLQQNMQPPPGILSCSSPTGSSAADSSSYSPTNSIRYFTPSPPEVHKPTVNGHIQAPRPQLPLLFSAPTAVTLPSSPTTTSTTSIAPHIAVPIAINPLLAGCSTSNTVLTETLNKNSFSEKRAALGIGFQSTVNNKQIVESFLANMRLLEQKICGGISHEDASNTVVDVCSV